VDVRLSHVTRAGLAAALAATYTLKEEMRGLQSRLAATETSAAAAAAAAASHEKGGNVEGGGLVQQKEYIRKLKAVLKERESELEQVTSQLKDTRGQEAQFLAEVQLLQGRIKKLTSSSVARYARSLDCRCSFFCFSCVRSRRHLETKIQALEAEGQGLEGRAGESERMFKAQVTACDIALVWRSSIRHASRVIYELRCSVRDQLINRLCLRQTWLIAPLSVRRLPRASADSCSSRCNFSSSSSSVWQKKKRQPRTN
jgi:hypothetical protein